LRVKKFSNPYIKRIKEFDGIVLSMDDLLCSRRGFNFPVCIDIGCGNGEYLVDVAAKNPDKFYIGFERQYKEVYRTASKIKKLGLNNCKVASTDAKDIPAFFKKNEIADVFILFPDPWPKARQKKKRLINKDYIKSLLSNMIKGSYIKFRTDNDDYFSIMLSVVYDLSLEGEVRILELSRDFRSTRTGADEYITPFERIFMRQGLLINYMLVQRS